MWNVGHEPFLRMTVGDLMFLDRPPARADLIKRLGAAAVQAPRLRQYPGGRTFLRRHLTWVDDPSFDVRHHVRTMTIPMPGDQRQVLDLIALLEPVPFEHDRSPWDATLIDGLAGGGAALYLRAHHVLTDGMGGIPLIGLLHDESGRQDAPETWPSASQSRDAAAPLSMGRRPNTVTIDFAPAVRLVGSGLNASMTVDPAGILVRGIQRSLDVASSVSRQALVTGGPLSSLPSTRSMSSHFEVISVPGARAAALSLGGSRNDLLVAAAAGGVGLYEARLGQSCPELRVATPTTLRHGAGIGGNWYAPMRIEVPTAVEHPGPQFGIVAERVARARSEPARSLSAALAAVLGRLPTQVLTSALERAGRHRRPGRHHVARLPGRPPRLRSTRPAELPVRPSAGLSHEHQCLRQRRAPRRGNNARLRRHHRARRDARVHDRGLRCLRAQARTPPGGKSEGAQ